MPIVLGQLVFALVVTTVGATVAVALGTLLALVEEGDRRHSPQ